jgi:hypothetical protein
MTSDVKRHLLCCIDDETPLCGDVNNNPGVDATGTCQVCVTFSRRQGCPRRNVCVQFEGDEP